jgi:hypothetical protein
MQRNQDAGPSRGCQPALAAAAPAHCCRPHPQTFAAHVCGFITAVTRGLKLAIAEGLQVESEQIAALVSTADLGEGINAWIERRAPHYRSR